MLSKRKDLLLCNLLCPLSLCVSLCVWVKAKWRDGYHCSDAYTFNIVLIVTMLIENLQSSTLMQTYIHKVTGSVEVSVPETVCVCVCVRWKMVDHYVSRVRGTMQLLQQHDIIGRTSELARVFGIQFFHVLTRGSQVPTQTPDSLHFHLAPLSGQRFLFLIFQFWIFVPQSFTVIIIPRENNENLEKCPISQYQRK